MSSKKQPQMPDGYVGFIDASSIGGPPRPQVNLLPADVRNRRALGGVKLRLAAVMLAVVGVLAFAFLSAVWSEDRAVRDLEAKEAEVVRLQAEMTQYAEVPKIKRAVADARLARDFGMSTEVLWGDYLRAIQAVQPEGWTITELASTLPLPMEDAQSAANPLAAPSFGVITFQARALTLPDIPEWLERIETVPGFSDAAFSSAVSTSEEGVDFYEVSATVQVNHLAFAHRFVETEGGEG